MSDLEFVWVVRRRDLFPDFVPHGFVSLAADDLMRTLDVIRERGFFVERREAERHPAWKQSIPYCIVRWEGQILVMERLRAQSESRLHGKRSIGVGGHVNPVDREAQGDDLLLSCAVRELHEELIVDGEIELEPLGLLNDDTDPVGAVHVGVVYGVAIFSNRPAIRETHKMAGRFHPLAEIQDLCQDSARIESWTRMLLAAAFRESSDFPEQSGTGNKELEHFLERGGGTKEG